MRIAIFIATFILGLGSNAQTFNERYDLLGVGRAQGAWNIEIDSDSSFWVMSVSSEIDSLGPNSFWTYYALAMTRINQDGDLLQENKWHYPWHGVTSGWSNCSVLNNEGNYIVGGTIEDSTDHFSVFLASFDYDGDTIWTSILGDTTLGGWIGYQVKQCSDGGYIIVGLSDIANGSNDGMVLKTDSLGNEEWHQLYGGSQYTDLFVSIEETSNGGYFVGGVRIVSQDDHQYWVLSIDSVGNINWQRIWGSIYDDPQAHLTTVSDGNVVMASSWLYDWGSSDSRAYMAKLDAIDGSIIWDNEYGAIEPNSTLFAVKEVNNSDLIAAGVIRVDGAQKGQLLRTNDQGDSLWMRSYFYIDSVISNGQGRFYDALPTPDGGFIAAGAAYNPNNAPYPPGYSQDTWVVKVDSLGCIEPGCHLLDDIQEIAVGLDGTLRVWPNPANNQVQLSISIPANYRAKGQLQIDVFSLEGRHVHSELLTNSIGTSTIQFSVTDLSNGIYTAHLSDGGRWLDAEKLVVE